MRNSTSLDALLPRVRQEILATLLMNPDRKWYLSALAKHLRSAPSSLQRELASLSSVGILAKTQDGNRTYYAADPRCPVLPDLRGLLTKTVGLVDQVRQALIPESSSIQVAFVFGSVADGSERGGSDVDLVVVGPIGLAKLAGLLKPAEDRLLRSINPSLYSEAEFAETLKDGGHFLTRVLKSSKLFIIGSDSDLAAIAERRSGTAARNEQIGA